MGSALSFGILELGGGDVAGRYQGCHAFRDESGEHLHVEVFWQTSGWFWRCIEDRRLYGEPVGPFTTSSDAYESAKVALYLAA